MDYEKKYNEALERARKIHDEIVNNEVIGFPGQITDIFPELRESEDERVIRTLYYLVRDHDWVNGATKGEALAYLEKQKNASKAIEAVERIDKYIDEHVANAHDMKDSNPDKKYYRGWDDALGKMAGILQDVYSNEKQKESLHIPESCKENPDSFTDEDERIRKEIIDIVEAYRANCVYEGTHRFDDCLAWLEKQKYDRMKPIYDARESFESALEKAWNDYHNGYENVDKLEDDYVECAHAKGFREGYLFGLEKHKEHSLRDFIDDFPYSDQKKQKYIPKFKVGDKLVSTKNPHLTYEIFEVGHINELGNPEYKVEIFTDGKPDEPHNIHYMECCKVDEWGKRIEQKSIKEVIKDITKNKESAINFLKSAGIMDDNGELAEIYRSEQESSKWSEEDEIHRNFILESLEDQIRFCKKDAEGAYYVKQIRTAQNWLKAFKPSWKPSEEQMRCFDIALALSDETMDENLHNVLVQLREQLKKL